MVQLIGKDVGNTGYGMMGLTWREKPQSQEKSIEALKSTFKHNVNFWNGGELYGPPNANSLQLLNAYFTKYPEDADKIVLSIKGCLDLSKMAPDGTEEGVKKSIDNCLKVLDGKKKLDLFEAARVDPNVPIEDTVRYIKAYVDAGKVGGICLSEVSAESVRRAAKVATIAGVEVEFSMFSTDILENGIAKACAELNIPIIAYSPLGRGFLTGEIKSIDDIPEGDFRRHAPRFQPGAFEANLKLVDRVKAVADKQGATVGQVALAWVRGHSGRDGLGEIIPIPGATTPERIDENCKEIKLSEQEMKELDELVFSFEVTGGRYGGPQAKMMNG